MGWKRATRRFALRAARRMPWLTRQRLAVFGATLVAVGIALEGLDPSRDSTSDITARTANEIIPLELPERLSLDGFSLSGNTENGLTVEVVAAEWIPVTVRNGQTLDAIFREQGFSATTLHNVVRIDENTRKLTKIRPGDIFEFIRDDSGQLLRMRYALSESQHLIVSNEGGSLQAQVLERSILTEIEEAEGIIRSSLFSAAKEAGLSDAMTLNLANIFGWDIDFVLDIREGDRFFLVYEKLYREGEFLRDGRILAATFVSQGERYQAVRFEIDGKADYYAVDGRPMRKAFLRAPLNFSYISSAFNPRRMHPILKRIRPHNGTDYHAPRGTPVYAAGDGTVIRSGYSNANGHHVFIQHANSMETRYLHFTNRAVKKGQKVRQGQTIGYVGSTGLASGPHLHYEFLVNGKHRNPRTVPLPPVEQLENDSLLKFQQHSAPMLTRLSRLESASLYASAE
jgi:murein DD-endopeptidase MepM/ murein hydrolase activator NlpD